MLGLPILADEKVLVDGAVSLLVSDGLEVDASLAARSMPSDYARCYL